MLNRITAVYGIRRIAGDFGRWVLWQPTKVLLFTAGFIVETIGMYR